LQLQYLGKQSGTDLFYPNETAGSLLCKMFNIQELLSISPFI
jgi:hypothetical protein